MKKSKIIVEINIIMVIHAQVCPHEVPYYDSKTKLNYNLPIIPEKIYILR